MRQVYRERHHNYILKGGDAEQDGSARHWKMRIREERAGK
jgi:hypothetical protein